MKPLERNAERLLGRLGPRLAWLTLVPGAAPAFAAAFADRSRGVQFVGSVGLWAGWAVGLALLVLPSTVALTGMRMLAPLAPFSAVAAGVAGGPTALELAGAVALGLLVVSLVFSGEFGRTFAQASAYGDETRYPLRPPGALVAGPIPLLWGITAFAVVAGPLLLAARQWVLGGFVSAAGAASCALLAVRFHRLSRRWLVFVPAGTVVHDHVVLAETAMFPVAALGSCGLAAADTEAADFTGNALGPAVEFRLRTAGDKVVLAPTRADPRGKALHVRSFFVSPTRPGAVLAEARRRGIAGFDD